MDLIRGWKMFLQILTAFLISINFQLGDISQVTLACGAFLTAKSKFCFSDKFFELLY